MCFGALGSDTGGSIRQPAAFCGIVGLKPSYGRVSTRGVMPLSWSLDHVGPFARNVIDTALLLEAIAGYDELDPTSVDWPAEKYASGLNGKLPELRIGLVRRLFFETLDPEIEQAVNGAIEVISKMAREVRDIDLPDAPTTVIAPEAFAIHRQYLNTIPELYQTWTRERLTQAGKIGTVDYVEGRRELERVRRSINSVFATVDLLVTPTTPVPPITIAEATNMPQPPSPGEVWLRNTRPFNAYGLPTISLPCGFTDAGLPIGLQIAGPRFGESKVFALAHAFEQATDWHKRKAAFNAH
jgi:aspartyl-tRNA(Asn)/glutamyl-tRNA(Gln) amidotransferase subunit A